MGIKFLMLQFGMVEANSFNPNNEFDLKILILNYQRCVIRIMIFKSNDR